MAQVNRPTNVRQKEEDVNQKLQLYGIYSGTSLDFADFVSSFGALSRSPKNWWARS